MRIAVLGSSPIMLIAARYLTAAGHNVKLFEKRSKTGGAWIAPGLFGLKHRHANLVVAYNNNDLKTLNIWKDFLRYEMNMKLEAVPNKLINISTKYHTSYKPDFTDAYASEQASIAHAHVKYAEVNDKRINVNGEFFDHLFLPAFCSMNTIIINGESHKIPFKDATSLHVICKDTLDSLPFVYLEGDSDIDIFDRYFKCLESGIFVARVRRDFKSTPRNVIAAELDKKFKFMNILEYKSNYRNPEYFDKFKRIEQISFGRISILDTRQFCWGLKSLDALKALGAG